MNRQQKTAPVKIAIVLPERVWAGPVFLTKELLLIAGALSAHTGNPSGSIRFEVSLVGSTRKPVQSLSGLSIEPDATLKDVGDCDVVIVPPQFAPRGELEAGERAFTAWITAQHGKGALIVSMSGTILVAKCGLLDHKQATGLRSETALFEQYFPAVRFTPSRHIVVNDQIICAGGISPMADICAHLIERFYGQAAARKFKRHATSGALPGQEQLAVWSAQFKQHKDQQILSVQSLIENNLSQLPGSSLLAGSVHLSERTLSRRFAEAVGTSVRRYAADCRLEMARLLLRTTDDPLQLVANECGFASTSALVHSFGLRYGISPVRYRHELRNN